MAWARESEIYRRKLTDMFWTVPLAHMGAQGWELVSVTTENALMGSWVKGWDAATSRPIRTNFFFKRPVPD